MLAPNSNIVSSDGVNLCHNHRQNLLHNCHHPHCCRHCHVSVKDRHIPIYQRTDVCVFCSCATHTALEGRKTENKFTGAGIGAKFFQIMYRVTTKNLQIGQRRIFEKMYVLYVAMAEKPLSSGQKWFLR